MLHLSGVGVAASLVDAACVLAFAAVMVAWLGFSKRKAPGTLLHLLAVAATLAVANQVGNAGWTALAVIMIAAACCYAVIVIKTE